MNISPRTRRLRTDLRVMKSLSGDSSILDFRAPPTQAEAPDSYVVKFRGRGLWRDHSGNVLVRDEHEVFIKLGAGYPRGTPELAWRSPVFHPNISAGGAVCLGGYGTHWTPSLMLDELCGMLWDMIRYANYDVESPYNREAAHWAKSQTRYQLPLDRRPIRDRLAGVDEDLRLPPVAADSGGRPQGRPPVVRRPEPQAAATPEVVFLSEAEIAEADIVDAELVEEPGGADGPDILFIE